MLNSLSAIFTTLALVFITNACLANSIESSGFPVVIEHRYGKATIESEPKRVVSIGYTSHDFVLAFGVKPIGLRRWYGNYENGVWPWAQAALGDAKPVVMWGSINVEQIASLKPDLIVATMSGITRAQYDFLSKIAPTLVGPTGSGFFDVSWQDQTRMLGKAFGKSQRAEFLINDINQRLAKIRKAHPQWQNMSASVWWAGKSNIVYVKNDPRSRLMRELGFSIPTSIDEMVNTKYEFYASPSSEALADFDTDVFVWFDPGENRKTFSNRPLRKSMRAWREGRELYLNKVVSSALAHSSPLSLHYVLDNLIPLLEQASDGDPNTQVSSMPAETLPPKTNSLPTNPVKDNP